MASTFDETRERGWVVAVRVIASAPERSHVTADFDTFAQAFRYCQGLPSIMTWRMVLYCQSDTRSDVGLNVYIDGPTSF